MLKHEQLLMLELLRSAIWGIPIEHVDYFATLTTEQWKDIQQQARLQGVSGLVWSTVEQLPKEYHPERVIKIAWALEAEEIKRRYLHQCDVAATIGEKVANAGFRMLVFKGIALSCYYPHPPLRECGDIDCFFYGEWEKVEDFLLNNDVAVERLPESHHDHWVYHDVILENHRYFLNSADRKILKGLDELFIQQLHLNSVPFQMINTTLYVPGIEFDLLHTAYHAAKHFVGECIVLRHLCDWSLLVATAKPDLQQFRNSIESEGFRDIIDGFSHLSVELLGLAPELISGVPRKDALVARMKEEIFLGGMVELRQTSNGWHKLLIRWQNYHRRAWKYRLVYHHSIWWRFPGTFFRLLSNPIKYMK